MAIASNLIITLLFGIIIPWTVAMTTFMHILVPANGHWQRLLVNLQEEDNFGGSINGLSKETLVTALRLDNRTTYAGLGSFLQTGIQNNTIQIQVERFNVNRRTAALISTTEKVEDGQGGYVDIYGFEFTYDFPTIKLYYNSQIGWDGLYNSQTNEMKLIREDSKKSDLDNLLRDLITQKFWDGKISYPKQPVKQESFKEPISLGLKENNGFTSLVLTLNRFVKGRTSTSTKELQGYHFTTLGKLELLVKTVELDAVKANIDNSFWGSIYLDNSKSVFDTVHFTGSGETKDALQNDHKLLVVNYVQGVRIYNENYSVVVNGLKTGVDRQIQMIDTESNLQNFQATLKSTGKVWFLDMGLEGVKSLASIQPEPALMPATVGLYSLIVNYT